MSNYPLDLIKRLIKEIQTYDISYCHWKSNYSLEAALQGEDDLDLLVNRKDAQKFEAILAPLGFKQAKDIIQSVPSVVHFYALDAQTGEFVHLHVYYQIMTGGSLLKNYHLPIENLLLEKTKIAHGIHVPKPSAELIAFVIRVMTKHSSLLEYLLFRSSGNDSKEELFYLLGESDNVLDECLQLLDTWLPFLDNQLFVECLNAIAKNKSLFVFWILALKLRKSLSPLERFSLGTKSILRINTIQKRMIRRWLGPRRAKQLITGGAVITFVGPKATGKSTLTEETKDWLGEVFSVHSAHLGKPPATWLTFMPNLILPWLRRVFPKSRAMFIEKDGNTKRSMSFLYLVRSVLVARDRYKLAIKLQKKAYQGDLVICDRYPSSEFGAIDSGKLFENRNNTVRSRVLSYFADLECSFYTKIPPPSIAIELQVSLGVALERNQTRQKKGKGTAQYVSQRHAQGIVPSFPSTITIKLNVDCPQKETEATVKKILWSLL